MTSPLGPAPGNPPPGHTQVTLDDCGTSAPCVIEYGPDGQETARWSCMVRHFPSRPLDARTAAVVAVTQHPARDGTASPPAPGQDTP